MFAFPIDHATSARQRRTPLRACFMIELIMNVGLGFLAASLLALVTIPLVHDRAVVAAVEPPHHEYRIQYLNWRIP